MKHESISSLNPLLSSFLIHLVVYSNRTLLYLRLVLLEISIQSVLMNPIHSIQNYLKSVYDILHFLLISLSLSSTLVFSVDGFISFSIELDYHLSVYNALI